jgi:carbonic anhydrase/acetyltransferase-like protein (isoleucine patch superfamily)
MIRTITTGWNFMRIFRVTLGIAAMVQGARVGDGVFLAAGAILLVMGFANLGCCGANGCSVPVNQNQTVNRNDDKELDSEK